MSTNGDGSLWSDLGHTCGSAFCQNGINFRKFKLYSCTGLNNEAVVKQHACKGFNREEVVKQHACNGFNGEEVVK